MVAGKMIVISIWNNHLEMPSKLRFGLFLLIGIDYPRLSNTSFADKAAGLRLEQKSPCSRGRVAVRPCLGLALGSTCHSLQCKR